MHRVRNGPTFVCRFLIVMALLAVAGQRCMAGTAVWYVDQNAHGTGDGSTWANAFTDLQAALGAARAADPQDRPAEIWVVHQTFRPFDDPDDPAAPTYSFELVPGVKLRGGFAGTETSPADRPLTPANFEAQGTTLTGFIGFSSSNEPVHAYHVVRASSPVGSDALLEGFRIVQGNSLAAPTESEWRGSGVYIIDANPTISLCAIGTGGGVGAPGAAQLGSGLFALAPDLHLTLTDCSFNGGLAMVPASATELGFSAGGGLWIESQGVTLLRCTFVGNNAQTDPSEQALCFGGAAFVSTPDDDGVVTIRDCFFEKNATDPIVPPLGEPSSGGGLYVRGNSIKLARCRFVTHNGSAVAGGLDAHCPKGGTFHAVSCRFTACEAALDAGAARVFGGGAIRLENCMFWGNPASSAPGELLIDSGYSTAAPEVSVTNCTFAGPSRSCVTNCWLPLIGVRNRLPETTIPVQVSNTIAWPDWSITSDWYLFDDGTQLVGPPDSLVDLSPAPPFGGQVEWEVLYSNVYRRPISISPLVIPPWPPDVGQPSTHGNIHDVYPGGPGVGSSDAGFGQEYLSPTSPCVDAGSNLLVPEDSLDIDGDMDVIERLPRDGRFLISYPRVTDIAQVLDSGQGTAPIVDMGALESFDRNGNGIDDFKDFPCLAVAIADWDLNGLIEPADVAAFIAAWQYELTNGGFLTDVDGDGAITPSDVAYFVQIWFQVLTNGGCP